MYAQQGLGRVISKVQEKNEKKGGTGLLMNRGI